MSKRPREAVDVADDTFSKLQAELDNAGVQKWNTEERTKLLNLFSAYIGIDPDSYNDEDPTGPALPSAESKQQRQLWQNLATAKVHLKSLVGPFESASGKDGAKAPTYETGEPTFEIDSFLYEDDEDIDDLCAAGAVSRDYCTKCGSCAVAPTRFISHSFSSTQLSYLFTSVLPFLESNCGVTPKSLVDVGSRLGVVPLAALLATSIQHISGIELNKDYCDVSEKLLQRMKLSPEQRQRVVIKNTDALKGEGLDLIVKADIVVLNNVFEWYAPTTELLKIWTTLKKATQGAKGKILWCNPSLLESLTPLLLDEQSARPSEAKAKKWLSEWVEELDITPAAGAFANANHQLLDEGSDDGEGGVDLTKTPIGCIHVYRVKG